MLYSAAQSFLFFTFTTQIDKTFTDTGFLSAYRTNPQSRSDFSEATTFSSYSTNQQDELKHTEQISRKRAIQYTLKIISI